MLVISMVIANIHSDSDSVCEGSNPSSAANPVTVPVTGFLFLLLSNLSVNVKIFMSSLKCKKQTGIYAFEIKCSQNVKY